MKTYIVSFIFITLSYVGFSQPIIEFEKNYGGSFEELRTSFIKSLDGGYVFTCRSASNDIDVSGNNGAGDYWVVKLSESYDIEWQNSYGGSAWETPYNIIQTSDGGYIISGRSSSIDGDVTGNHGLSDIWVLKLDSGGNIEWQNSYGGSNSEVGGEVISTLEGGYIVLSGTYSNDGDVTLNHGGSDVWIVKLDSLGVIEWEKSYGGSNHEEAAFILQTNDGGFVFASETKSNDGDITVNNGISDYWVVKINSVGLIEWEKTYGGTETDIPKYITQTIDGGYLVSGFSDSVDGDVSFNYGNRDAWVVKIDSFGSIDWEKSYGGSENDYILFANQETDNSFLFSGSSYSNDGNLTENNGERDSWIFKTTEEGELIWQKSFGGSGNEESHKALINEDSSIITIGESTSSDGDVSLNYGDFDVWLVQFSENLSINDDNLVDFLIYPNPTNDIVTIKAEDLKEITIYNSLGKKVYFKELSGESTANIDVSHLAKGVYTVVVLASNQQTVKKFIIK